MLYLMVFIKGGNKMYESFNDYVNKSINSQCAYYEDEEYEDEKPEEEISMWLRDFEDND